MNTMCEILKLVSKDYASLESKFIVLLSSLHHPPTANTHQCYMVGNTPKYYMYSCR